MGVVVGEVAREVPAVKLGDKFSGQVIAFVLRCAVDPIRGRLVGGGHPGAGGPAQHHAGVIAGIEALGVEFPGCALEGHAAFQEGIGGQKVQRAPKGLIGTGGDVCRPLGDVHAPKVCRIDVAVGLGAAAVVRVAIGHAVDGHADLLVREARLEAPDGNGGRPVVEAEGIPFLHAHAGEIVDDRGDAGDGGLLGHHGVGDRRIGEGLGLAKHHNLFDHAVCAGARTGAVGGPGRASAGEKGDGKAELAALHSRRPLESENQRARLSRRFMTLRRCLRDRFLNYE